MRGVFGLEGPVMNFITKITYSAYLNILWLVCCLPVVTIGASTTALFYVTLKVARNEEGTSLTKAFFHSFKANFRQSTVIWLILLAAGIVLGFDGYIFYHMRFENAFWTVATAVFLVAVVAYAIILMYIFPPACAVRQHCQGHVQKCHHARHALPALHGGHGCDLFRDGVCRHQCVHAHYHFRRGAVRTALLLSALQHSVALPGKAGGGGMQYGECSK